MSMSVIIPVYNGGQAFRQCLASVVANAPSAAEIIVVADGDARAADGAAGESGVQVLVAEPRGGPARARNLGARAARGDILFFVDSDVLLPAGAVGQIAEEFRQRPGLAAVFGSYDDEPAEKNFLSQYKNLLNHYVHQTARQQASTFWGACGAIRRDVFLDLGGFNERYSRPCVEDIELGYRLGRHGGQILLCKALQVKHLKRWNARSLVVTDLLGRALPWTSLILRYRRFINDLNLRWSSRASVALAWVFVIALPAAFWWLGSLAVAAAAGAALLGLNAPLYRFFLKKRGLWFAVRTVPWHWLYYLYSGLAFAVGLLKHLACRGRPAPAPEQRDPVKDLASGEG